MTPHIHSHDENGVRHLTLARPEKKNAITDAMYGALADELVRAEEDERVRCVLFSAQGDSFTSGNDIQDFKDFSESQTAPTQDRNVYRFLRALATAQKPYVASVQGLAVGIGTTMLLHCDLVYVATDAKLWTPFINLGLTPEAGSSVLLPTRIGHVRAFAMFALGEPIDGATAAALGIANQALPAGEVHGKALAAARKLADSPSEAIRAIKRAMRDRDAIAAAVVRDSETFAERLRSTEAKAALSKFLQRGKPERQQD
jgi:enoyl-CoA hydratase/carnithine racemase